ncbi:nucleotidyl transferase AbiEii/AbiGii toxin family protein [Corallococcus exercitus]|uniref:Nucleotidyl transferase AbiEii/AbiGii toxin family protein n=1 Tax=Corallococcus exercitus TaxID=2316736 RepID=A0A7Y4NIK8_9BACT|nr:nucleotidyl transferase AbiEii/AbiGii toxin family protein [Corallococcus exercitus]
MTSTFAFELAVLTASAIASSASLMDRLVLKGGNALQLIHQLGARASMDLDYSMEGDVEDADALGRELETALSSRFSAAGYALIDFRFGPKPSTSGPGFRNCIGEARRSGPSTSASSSSARARPRPRSSTASAVSCTRPR